jgi:phosphate transport system permease protein
MVWHVSLPAALPGIMTGAILSMSRAVGEAAPILLLGASVYLAHNPQHLMDDFTVLPVQIYFWAGLPPGSGAVDFQDLAAGAIVVLLVILLSFNTLAILIRQCAQKQQP